MDYQQVKLKMSYDGHLNQGTGLRDVFNILLKVPSERLLSLTIQLGESPEDNIIHALCLIVLQRQAQALNKLQMLKDNSLANHLAEKCQLSRGKLEDFGVYCGHFQALTEESLAALARIFKVLSEQGLCDALQRNLAYRRALSSDCLKTRNCDDLEYDQFREEAKVVCGPQFAEWMSSSTDLLSESYLNSLRSLDESSTALKCAVSQHQSASTHCNPSPLQASSSMPSYPTHLEISIPPTVSFQGDKIAPETSRDPQLNPPLIFVSKHDAKNPPQSSELQPKSSGSPLLGATKNSKMDETLAAMTSNQPITKPSVSLPTAANSFTHKDPVPKEIHESKGAEAEEEDIFYAFVIMHAPEDADMAECIKDKVETVIGSEGATFSEDFAIPGKSTLQCVEDAINNSAFTFLLLTRNFNTRMLEMKTNSALINSINKIHKYNTVIPLLPRENRMPRQSIPLALQTLVPLDENKNFEKKLQKSLSPAKIEKQKRIWTKEQEQARLKCLQLQHRTMNLLMEQRLLRGPCVQPDQDGADSRVWWTQQPNIHIQNAKYIMIGNDSQMTVDLGGSADREDSVYPEEEQ